MQCDPQDLVPLSLVLNLLYPPLDIPKALSFTNFFLTVVVLCIFRYLTSVGTESGRIVLYSWGPRAGEGWNLLLALDQSYPFNPYGI